LGKTIKWLGDRVCLLDQTKLPLKEKYLECFDYQSIAKAIKEMRIRGAPAIGVAAAFGIALAAQNSTAKTLDEFLVEVREATSVLSRTRPTAVNLFRAINRMINILQTNKNTDVLTLKRLLKKEAEAIAQEEEEMSQRMGEYGATLVRKGANILTHCNAGALATVDLGTALAVIRKAHEQGKKVHVYADETRPLLQGARLTTWELIKEGIPTTLICDNMAGFLMQQGKVDLILVGADRIAANGDVANKIGTYSLAVLAREHQVPFYVVAPTSTIDLAIANGNEIPIEERSATEVTMIAGQRIAPEEVNIYNPAFDITPARYISAIVTDRGIIRPPYTKNLAKILS
jgi:methylthioribose-1-phosphate isomerase